MAEKLKNTTIELTVSLSEDNVPQKIHWFAEDNPDGVNDPSECKAMLLSIFDKESLDTLKIDLWTKEMTVAEMDRFFFQTLKAMGDTYSRATKNKELGEQLQKFVQYFGEQTEILQ